MGNLSEKLFIAASEGKLEDVKKLIEKDQKKKIDYNFEKIIDKETKETRTILGIAVENNHLDVVKELLKYDVDLGKASGEEGVPITIACRNGNLEIMKELMGHEKCDVDICDSKGDICLTIACKTEDTAKGIELIGLLSKHEKININKGDKKGYSALMYCVENGKNEYLEELLKVEKLDPNIGDVEKSISPLFYICENGKNFEAFKLLLGDKRIQVNKEDKEGRFNPLFLLIDGFVKKKEDIYFDMFSELIKHPDVDVNHARSVGEGPKLPIIYSFAGRGEETEQMTRIFKALFEHEKLDILKGDDNLKNNTVFNICCLKEEKRLNYGKLIMSHSKFDINYACGECRYGIESTPLICSLSRDFDEMSKILVDTEGIDLTLCTNQGDKPGLNALQICCLKKKYEFVRLLLKIGCDVNIGTNEFSKDKHDTVCPLFAACAQDDTELATILLEQEDIDVNRREEPPYMTPLFIACQRGCLDIIKLITQCEKINVNKGRCDPPGSREDVKGKFVKAPLSASAEKGDIEAVKVLLSVEGMDPNVGYPKSPWALAKTEDIKKLIGEHSKFKRSDWEF